MRRGLPLGGGAAPGTTGGRPQCPCRQRPRECLLLRRLPMQPQPLLRASSRRSHVLCGPRPQSCGFCVAAIASQVRGSIGGAARSGAGEGPRCHDVAWTLLQRVLAVVVPEDRTMGTLCGARRGHLAGCLRTSTPQHTVWHYTASLSISLSPSHTHTHTHVRARGVRHTRVRHTRRHARAHTQQQDTQHGP